MHRLIQIDVALNPKSDEEREMGIGRYFQRRDKDADLAREIDAHIAHEIDENMARGMTEAESRRRARGN